MIAKQNKKKTASHVSFSKTSGIYSCLAGNLLLNSFFSTVLKNNQGFFFKINTETSCLTSKLIRYLKSARKTEQAYEVSSELVGKQKKMFLEPVCFLKWKAYKWPFTCPPLHPHKNSWAPTTQTHSSSPSTCHLA